MNTTILKHIYPNKPLVTHAKNDTCSIWEWPGREAPNTCAAVQYIPLLMWVCQQVSMECVVATSIIGICHGMS